MIESKKPDYNVITNPSSCTTLFDQNFNRKEFIVSIFFSTTSRNTFARKQ